MLHSVKLVVFLSSFHALLVFGMEAIPLGKTFQDIHLQEVLQDIAELSSPKYQGRLAGTAGGEQSAHFIAERFETLGLAPVVQNIDESSDQQWFQNFPLTATKVLPPTLVEIFPIQNQG